MSDNTVYVRGGGISSATVTAILAVLKIAGVINVSWLWVLAPLWLPFALLACILLMLGLGAIVGFGGFAAFAAVMDRKKHGKVQSTK